MTYNLNAKKFNPEYLNPSFHKLKNSIHVKNIFKIKKKPAQGNAFI